MPLYTCRLHKVEHSTKHVDAMGPDYAPDEYVHETCDMSAGDSKLVEVLDDETGDWKLWNVECLIDNQAYLTSPVHTPPTFYSDA